MNFIFNDNVRILCLSCNVKKVGKLVRFKQKGQKQVLNIKITIDLLYCSQVVISGNTLNFINSVFNGVKVQVTNAICTFRYILNEWIYYQIP
jgi:hypothetical protein